MKVCLFKRQPFCRQPDHNDPARLRYGFRSGRLLALEVFGPRARCPGSVEGIGRAGVEVRLLDEDGRVVVYDDAVAIVAPHFDVRRELAEGVGADGLIEVHAGTVPVAAERDGHVCTEVSADVGHLHELLLLAGSVVVDLDLSGSRRFAGQKPADAVNDIAGDEAVGQRLVVKTAEVDGNGARLDGVARDRLRVAPESGRGDQGHGQNGQKTNDEKTCPMLGNESRQVVSSMDFLVSLRSSSNTKDSLVFLILLLLEFHSKLALRK